MLHVYDVIHMHNFSLLCTHQLAGTGLGKSRREDDVEKESVGSMATSKLRTGSSKSLKSWSQSSSRSKREMKRERKRRREEERRVEVEGGEEGQGEVVLQLKKQRVERATTISQSRVGPICMV